MTERENLRAMLSGSGADHLPLDVWLTEPSADMVEEHTGSRDPIDALGLCLDRIGPRYPHHPEEWRDSYCRIGFEVQPNALIGSLGTVHDVPPAASVGAAYHLLEMRHPLSAIESIDQLEALPWPSLSDESNYRHIPEAVKKAHARGVAAVGQMDCTAFESAWYLRGMDLLYLDLLDGTGIGDWLLDWFTRRAEVAIEHYLAAGVDIVWLGDDVGTQRGLMMAAPFWREHLKPRLVQLTERIRGSGTWIAYHSDGDVRTIIEDLIEIGIDVLNPVQPECMPTRATIERYQDRLAFWGMIGTQTTMPFGTPKDVSRVVDELRSLVRGGARIVASPTHAIEPDVPWQNLERLVRETHAPLEAEVKR